jgi:hypothetical protein
MTPLGRHALRQHVAVVTVARDHLVALRHRHLHAGDDRFLADIEVAEAADEAHAVELARLLLEAADEQHAAIGFELPLLAEIFGFWRDRGSPGFGVSLPGWRPLGGGGHQHSP